MKGTNVSVNIHTDYSDNERTGCTCVQPEIFMRTESHKRDLQWFTSFRD